MSDLHTTESAARLLGVSPASVRRWSDAGLLPVQRVGRRGSRRFREADLRSFQRRMGSSARGDGGGDAVAVGALRLPLHSHIPTFYDTDAGRLRLALPFLRDGLEAGEMCLVLGDPDATTEYVAALRLEGTDVDGTMARGQLEVRQQSGDSVKSALDAVESFFWRATRAGSRVPRAVGEMSSERNAFRSDHDMLDYEHALNALTRRFPCVVLCQYDVREFDGETTVRALKAHPDLFSLRLQDVLL